MKTYWVGIVVNFKTARFNVFCVRDKTLVPASCRELLSLKARNKKEARNSYLFSQL